MTILSNMVQPYSQPYVSSLPVKVFQSIDTISSAVAALHLSLHSDGCSTSLNVSLEALTPTALWSTMEQNRSPLQITKLICSISFTVDGCETLHSLPAADEWFY